MNSSLLQTWRWYGSNDPVSLRDVRQAGASGVVSALHQIPHGEIWPLDQIKERKTMIEAEGLDWVVVESVPVHESIKTRRSNYQKYLDNYKQTLINLSTAGLNTVCYNFMPVLDWTRTHLEYSLPNGSKALYFDWVDLAVFDLYILKRENASTFYSKGVLAQTERRFHQFSEAGLRDLIGVILMGVPTEGSVSLEDLKKNIEIYKSIGKTGLRENLGYFLTDIQEVCEEHGIQMTLHPDDPPYPILGLPRIASNQSDLIEILKLVDRPFNGICYCTGSLGAGIENDLLSILQSIGDRVHFVHLRNVKKNHLGNFFESDHLDGDVDMVAIMKELIRLNQNRQKPIPFRPDHGHQMLDDLSKQTNPGYSPIGRLKGLAELRGLEKGLEWAQNRVDKKLANDNLN